MYTTTTTTQTEAGAALNLRPGTKSILSFEEGRQVHHIPTFTDKSAERQWAKEQMAGAFRVFARLGWADGTAGHISLRDPLHPDLFWINPFARHFGILNVTDLVLVNKSGEAVEPTKYTVNAAGFSIHSALHMARPDVNVAIHMHSPHGRAWSIFGRPIEILTQDACYFYNNLSIYESFGGAAMALEEGKHIAEALGPKNKCMILQNHGILTCGQSVGEAAGFYIALERACEAQLLAEAAAANGISKRYIGETEAAYTNQLATPGFMYMQFLPEYERVLKETKGEFLDCERVGAHCKFLPTRKERALAQRQRSNLVLNPPLTRESNRNNVAGQTSNSTRNTTSRSFEVTPENILRGHRTFAWEPEDPTNHLESLYSAQLLSKAVDLFFHHFYTDLLFSLHEPSIRSNAKTGELKPILAVAILALTARFMPDLVEYHGSVQNACDYFANAIRAELILEADKPSLDKIHSLLLLTLHEWGSGRGARAWVYIGACIRSALLLRTFRKQTPLAPPFNKPLETPEERIVEESRIRVFWSMTLMEQCMANGKHRSHPTYDEQNSIGKPSFEENFLWGTIPHSTIGQSWQRESALNTCGSHSSEKACLISAVRNWNTVNRWVSSGGAKQEREPPWAQNSRFNQLRKQLHLWEANLPLKLQYNPNAFAIHNVNKLAGQYGFLHLVHYASVIFLHREYLEFFPDRRKPYAGRLTSQLESPAASSSVQEVFWAISLQELFTAAYRINEILSELESLGALMNTPLVGFAAFTASTMNMYLSIFHWVCPDLAKTAQKRAESDVRYVKLVLAVWPLAQKWYATILRLYDSYKLLHMSERTPQTPHVVDTFHSFDQSLFDYGEIKPGPDEMTAIVRAAKAYRTENSVTGDDVVDAQHMTGEWTANTLSGDFDWSLDIEQDQYWDHITDEFIGMMARFE
ncbi:hypothetical protein B7463_g822, partial [Scytalidium lignicola]